MSESEPRVYGSPEAIVALVTALVAAIKETKPVEKTGTGPSGFRYAPAPAIIAEAKRVLDKVGIIVAPVRVTLLFVGRSKEGERGTFELRAHFLVAHVGGGYFYGEMAMAPPANIAGTPPQATAAAMTGCERDFYRALLRLERYDSDDPDHPMNAKPQPMAPTQPARPALRPAATTDRKATRVLDAIRGAKTLEFVEGVAEKFVNAIKDRGLPIGPEPDDIDDCGYSDAEVTEIRAQLVAARARFNA